ncbi:ROK family transcriptional regulator [Pseudonocardiaceae bacterium YIM PH 21723]|nr:ROK family transcriptional regulator [Pseudonocardiaceae bacterium YIM PH 21723]
MRAGSPRLLREINDRAAIEALLRTGPLSRAELETHIGLSKPATAALLTRLESAGTVIRHGLRGGSRGPRAQLWAVNGGLAHVAAVDLTPFYVDVVLADIAGNVVTEHFSPMPPAGTAGVLGAFTDAIAVTCGKAGLTPRALRHLVVGAPGGVDPKTGHLEFAPHLPGWQGFDLPGTLRDRLGCPVTVDNDVNLAAVQEMHVGEATTVDSFVLVWLSQGIGSAVVMNRELVRGATGGAGEIDWMRVPDPDNPGTGSRLGELLSGGRLVTLGKAHGVGGNSSDAVIRTAVRMGRAGNGFLREVARRIAIGVAGVVSVLDPELILLAGELSQAGGDRLAELVGSQLYELVVPRPEVRRAQVISKPVRSGAVRTALAVAREQTFGAPQTL